METDSYDLESGILWKQIAMYDLVSGILWKQIAMTWKVAYYGNR